ncbi:MAG: ASKHA domain-containing protein, partial [Abditibacteriales bacterium]|nr:ASKHA domain-containing protein [Abditibacteriales bacterium]
NVEPANLPTSLVVDIGTNGEIVLCHKGKIFACSAAAGPAFEGARISCGMRGAPGAISSVHLNETVQYTTIDERPPRGICGSGLIDAVAQMLEVGILEPSGRMVTAYEVGAGVPASPTGAGVPVSPTGAGVPASPTGAGVPASPTEAGVPASPTEAGVPASPMSLNGDLRQRLITIDNERQFVLVFAEESATGKPITLSQRDVRQLQLAKGSICAAIRTLLQIAGVAPQEIDAVYLAGAFGTYLSKENALRIGLLPPEIQPDRIHPVGNAAGAGAKLALLSLEERQLADAIAQSVEHIELCTNLDYAETFMEAMAFPARGSGQS